MAYDILTVSQKENEFLGIESIMSLPKSLHEAYQLHMQKIDHPAVKLFSSSLHAHRSCNEAILFLYGVSGAGKSSTLNHLFSADLIPTSATRSATDSVTEWVSSVHSEHWRVSNLEVGFVDVPGWGDSEGRDATNFALMQQFLSVHPILGSKLRKFYPNIVLLVINSNDNRMLGSEASAHRMLTSLSKLDIVDKKRPNLVIVLTHVCSHPRVGFSEKLGEQSLIYQNIARACLGVNPHVVWMENNPDYELERRGDWTLLYDGTEQPLNLYEAIRDLMETAGDEIGKEALRLYFGSRIENLPKERLIINPKLCDKKTLTGLEREWLNGIRDEIPNYKSTTLNRCLLEFLNSSLQPELNINEADISKLLLALSSIYPDLSSINTKDLSVIESRLEPYMLSVKEKVFLVHALDLTIPKLPVCIEGVGRGYNMVNKSITCGDIFEISSSEKFCSFFNCPISNAFSILPFESKRVSLGQFRDLDDIYILDMTSLNYSSDVISAISYDGDLLAPLIDEVILKFWVETGLFSIQLNLPFVKISNKFCNHIESLPHSVFTKDGTIKDNFLDLFRVYGHYTILKASGGGLLLGEVPCEKSRSKEELFKTITPSIELYFDLIQDGCDWRKMQDDLSE